MKYKQIKNNTRQGLEVVLKRPTGGFKHVWLAAKSSIIVSEAEVTDLAERAARRELVSITPA